MPDKFEMESIMEAGFDSLFTAHFTISQDPEFIELVRDLEVKTGEKVLYTEEEVMLEKLKKGKATAKWGCA